MKLTPLVLHILTALTSCGLAFHLTATFVEGHNEWPAYRKWPWRAGVQHQLTTLQFQENHAGQAART